MKRKKLLFIFTIVFFTTKSIAQSPYINKVYDFLPAPGQFTNSLPSYVSGNTKADIIKKAQDAIAYDNEGMVSLGAYGGYIVFGFDHTVEHVPGKYDFKILGNAFYSASNPNGDASREGGSCEPGIVMVSYDENGDGLPNDTWYELAGSEYNSTKTIKNYRITYYKPDENKVRTPDNNYSFLNDTTYIKWKDNQGGQGYVSRNVYHAQSYYPSWITADSIVFTGTKLADNYVDESGNGSYYVGYAYHWGYVDNQPNTDDRSNFSIDWAVDANGNKVDLPGVDFVKVYTAVNQYNGWLGELSTEIMGATDLHLAGGDNDVPVFTTGVSLDKSSLTMSPGQTATLTATVIPTDATNPKITWKSSNTAVATVANGVVTAVAEGTATVQAITNDGYYIAACTVTVSVANGVGETAAEKPAAYYSSGTLHLSHLDGYNCTITDLAGKTLLRFTVNEPAESRPLTLPAGIYLLNAGDGKENKAFKLLIGNN
jgi:uncharacterized protein YjdB